MKNNLLWYKKEATIWEEALPLGNGSFGAMVYGGVREEKLKLNLDTFWTGYKQDKTNYDAINHLEECRSLIKEKKYFEAGNLITEKMPCKFSESYLPIGDIVITDLNNGKETEYYRELNIQNGIATTTYKVDGVAYSREVFISYADQVMVVKIKADKPCINVKISANSQVRYETRSLSNNEICMQGIGPSEIVYKSVGDEGITYDEKNPGISYSVNAKAVNVGGNVESVNGEFLVKAAEELVLIVAAKTNYDSEKNDIVGNKTDICAQCDELIKAAVDKGYEALKTAHIIDFEGLYSKSEVNFNTTVENNLPTDERILKFNKDSEDAGLIELLYNFGKYLLISSSRKGTLATNLQGIWNHNLRAAWRSNFTTNINTPMNYWAAEISNISECHEALFEFIRDIVKTGEKTAKNYYNCRGWVCHHNVDLWKHSTPTGPMTASYWPLASGWFCRHIYEHYKFTLDKDFLKENIYIMKKAAEFYLDFMTIDEDGYLMTSPSISPENRFFDEKGQSCAVAKSSTMDISIISTLFMDLIEAMDILGDKDEMKHELEEALTKMPPYKIGKHGQLQEWVEDFEEEEVVHRHQSHLYGLYPGDDIIKLKDEKLIKACETVLDRKGTISTGWSLAWRANTWARLRRGDMVFKLFESQLKLMQDQEIQYVSGGSYANLFCAHPPFQIDGNFGVAAAIGEMLIQSHEDYIELLPALPAQLNSGSAKNLRARGGFIVSFEFENGRVTSYDIKSIKKDTCRLKVNGEEVEVKVDIMSI